MAGVSLTCIRAREVVHGSNVIVLGTGGTLAKLSFRLPDCTALFRPPPHPWCWNTCVPTATDCTYAGCITSISHLQRNSEHELINAAQYRNDDCPGHDSQFHNEHQGRTSAHMGGVNAGVPASKQH